ncbi:hypothetical protein BN946_scf184858.g45 [Trametes cinnabarina]|uniref:CcmS related domain-containing protein n=1 Tax=Pycnoporus cinnabarinus TaxID=5643 RepID=A0A060SMH6_PYCCI|nr:hypothetical protein BN946_scf184858.g45 [Trametes cinnabarina]
MAKIKKQKTKNTEAEPSTSAQPVPSALEPGPAGRANSPSHDVRANEPAGHEGSAYGDWGATPHGGGDDAWGSDLVASEPEGSWGQHAGDNNGGGWDAPSGGDWGEPSPADGGWGAPGSPQRTNPEPYPMKKSSLKRSGARSHSRDSGPPPPPQQPPAPAAFHPSAAAHMASSHFSAPHPPQDWGAHAGGQWGEPSSHWGAPAPAPPPPPPKPPSAPPPSGRPAWANWANEARGMPMVNTQPVSATTTHAYRGHNSMAGGSSRRDISPQQRSQIMSSLLQAPNQYTKDYFSQAQAQQSHQAGQPATSHHDRQQQSLHPSQQWQDPQFLAEQQGIYRSLQESRTHAHARGHPQPVQQADSWGYMGGGAWGERASTISEEDEYEDEDNGWGDDVGGGGGGQGWGTGDANNGRVRFSPNISYSSSPRHRTNSMPGHPGAPHQQQQWGGSPRGNQQQFWIAPNANASKTMKFATGQISTTVFELAPPRNGLGELTFIDSHGAALKPAERAMFSRDRPAKERFRWGFNPDKDPRVGTLLRWIASAANGLATIGLQKFLETQEKGALFFNAEYRVPSPTPGAPPQPAYDWVTLDKLQRTLDATLQESVALYDPAFQVIVFVFLLSPSGNSMALWRRKLTVPDSLREEHRDDILAVKAELKDYPVYVDE